MLAEIFSAYDLIIVLVVVLLVFGGTQLPKLARSLGSASHEFKKGLEEGAEEGASAATDTTKADTDGAGSKG
ncbi:MAG TPA: twin-arginine translocase TatA/TatE family subunit [Acidimicrobiales bacterium]|nr:twin-arginine translocase TatA/TatE family subunit [Acidimicrobiales bacterium]